MGTFLPHGVLLGGRSNEPLIQRLGRPVWEGLTATEQTEAIRREAATPGAGTIYASEILWPTSSSGGGGTGA